MPTFSCKGRHFQDGLIGLAWSVFPASFPHSCAALKPREPWKEPHFNLTAQAVALLGDEFTIVQEGYALD